MKTIKQVIIEPVYVKHLPDISEMEEAKVYISKEFSCSGHRCLCGCGELTILPIDRNYGWQLIEEKDGKVTFTPSIGNYSFPCKSHYIITKNKANFV